MARTFTSNPGKTAKYYRATPKAAAKHSRDETKRNDTPKKWWQKLNPLSK